MKNRFLVICCLLALSVELFAQTQQGYVKTLGRPNQQGRSLSGVSIRVKGGHNTVLSGQNGRFEIPMPGKRLGESYALQQVQKSGYELKDKGVVGRSHAYSDKVPLTLVMFSRNDYQKDKQQIENDVYATVEKRYQADLARLEQQKKSNQIDIERYRQQLHQLQNGFLKIQGLVDGLAKHYAQVDYDELNEKEQEITFAIERGDMEMADSLLQLLGIQQRVADIANRLKKGQALKEEAQREMTEVLKRQEKDAEYLYQLYTIALGKYENDQARFYIETRAALDTTNVEWQWDAALFLCTTLSDFHGALTYGNRAFSLAKVQYGEISTQMYEAYTYMGLIWNSMGRYAQTLSMCEKAFDVMTKPELEVDSEEIAAIYELMSQVYDKQNNFVKSVEYNQKSIELLTEKYGEKSEEVANKKIGLAHLCTRVGAPQWAVEINQEVLQVYDSLNIKKDNVEAAIYNNLGMAYNALGNYAEAFKYVSMSFSINSKRLGINHPVCAGALYNMGVIKGNEGNAAEAMEYMHKALDIYQQVYGGMHQNVEMLCNSIGELYFGQKDYDHALEYVSRALEICQSLNEDRSRDEEMYLRFLCGIHTARKEFTQARSCLLQAFDLYKGNYPENHVVFGMLNYEMGILNEKEEKYDLALDCYLKYYDALKQDSLLNDKEKRLESACAAVYLTRAKCTNLPESTLRKYEGFASETVITITVMGPETPAGKMGLEGEYVVLRYNKWNLLSEFDIGEYNDTLTGKPKDIMLMRNQTVQEYHFDNVIGVRFNIKYVGKEEKDKMKLAYEKKLSDSR